tara:strand:+ start:1210 stop:1638 length:429 start_codon:yes stop_codon:yes gene_type:complete
MKNLTHDEQSALHICLEAHQGQFRRDGVTPYSDHPKQVGQMAKTSDEKIVAWLHDVVEDTDWTLQALLDQGFSFYIVTAIDAITKRDGEALDEYWARILENKLATQVKIYDMTVNLLDSPTKKQIDKYTKGLNLLLTHQLNA